MFELKNNNNELIQEIKCSYIEEQYSMHIRYQ